jgi:glutamine amidotransferase
VHGDRIIEHRLAGGRAVLGVCVGLQVMFEKGIEHDIDTVGLGEWSGVVERLDAPVVPNMGWARVEVPRGSVLFEGVEGERFYFVHSYAARSFPLEPDPSGRLAPPLVTWSEAGTPEHHDRFVAAVENGPLSATQFHPEKSGPAGLRLLRNWLATL